MSDIEKYLASYHEREVSDLENYKARVLYLESLIGESDIEKALIDDNRKLIERLRFSEGKYRAAQIMMEQKDEHRNRLIERSNQAERLADRLRAELRRLGAMLAK